MKKIKILCFLFFTNSLLANPLEPQNFVAPSQEELMMEQQNGSQNNRADLKANAFYLNLNPKDIKAIQKKGRRDKKCF